MGIEKSLFTFGYIMILERLCGLAQTDERIFGGQKSYFKHG